MVVKELFRFYLVACTAVDYFKWRRVIRGSVIKAVGEINACRGPNTTRFGAGPAAGRWERKFLGRARRYATCLAEVLRVA